MQFTITPQIINANAIQTVNARELHEFLGVGRDFTNWIKARIDKYDFVEGVDYLLAKIGEQLSSGTKYKSDYHISINMAKELSMVENNEKGKEARRYFIECEKKSKLSIPNFNNPAEAARAWALEYEAKQQVLQQLEAAAPKVEYVDNFVDRNGLRKLTDVAKELGVSGKALGAWLRENNHAWLQTPLRWKQPFIDEGYGVMKLTSFENNGAMIDTTTALITAKGDVFIKQQYCK